MSKQLLYDLNGTNKGKFRKYLDDFHGEPRIAWYPSSGTDFRPLLYISSGFSKKSPPNLPEPGPPDIFLFTDYFPWTTSDFLDSYQIYKDDRTEISANIIEELPGLSMTLDEQIVDFPEGSLATGHVVFLEVKINSSVLGDYTCPVIYAFVENASFCANKILPLHGKISHVIHVRFGGGCGGGGKSTGIWLLNILRQVNCEVFIHDSAFEMQAGDEFAMRQYPSLAGSCHLPESKCIRVLPGKSWSDYGVVSWNLL